MFDEKEISRGVIAFGLVKLFIAVIASPFLVDMAATSLATALSERAPTAFQVEQFADGYDGQRWLSIEGRLLVDYADVRASNNDFVHVHVPLVSSDWNPRQAVHVIGTFVMPQSAMKAWVKRISEEPRYTLTGTVFGPMRYWDMFPRLRFEEPIVYINNRDSPASPLFGFFFLAFSVFVLFVSWRWFLKLIFLWRHAILRKLAF